MACVACVAVPIRAMAAVVEEPEGAGTMKGPQWQPIEVAAACAAMMEANLSNEQGSAEGGRP